MKATKLDLYGLDDGLVDVEQLPLTDDEKAIVKEVQQQDKTLARYLHDHNGGHELVPVVGFKECDGCKAELATAKVYEPSGKERLFYPDKRGYLRDRKGNYLHRIIAYSYTMQTDYKLWQKAMVASRKYEVHHKNPAIRRLPHGNNVMNVKLLRKDLHAKYTEITRNLRSMVENDEEEIKLVKPGFYYSI